MNAATVAALLGIALFFSLIFIYVYMRLAGYTIRQYVLSKFWGKKGNWVWIHRIYQNKKWESEFVKMPPNRRVLIKKGDKPEDDQYANINEVIHTTDKSGNGTIVLVENVPFPVYLKKHFLTDDIKTINNLVFDIDSILLKKDIATAVSCNDVIRKFTLKLVNDLRDIPDAVETLRRIIDLSNQKEYKDKEIIELLPKYRTDLIKLKQIMSDRNMTFVNVYDLFSYFGYNENISKALFTEFQNGFMAAQQLLKNKKEVMWTLIVCAIIGILVVAGIVMANKQNKIIDAMQVEIYGMSYDINRMTDLFFPDVNTIAQQGVINYPVNNPVVPNNPLGR